MAEPIRVTVYDPETGETATREVNEGDYALVCHSPCFLDHTQADLVAGVHVITVRGVRRA